MHRGRMRLYLRTRFLHRMYVRAQGWFGRSGITLADSELPNGLLFTIVQP